MTEKQTSTIHYSFGFDTGNIIKCRVELDDATLDFINRNNQDYPEWTRLEYHQCSNCPLDPDKHPYCPVAVNLVDTFEAFRNTISYEKAMITIESADRTYSRYADVQHGLSSLLGVIMASSGCPLLDRLRPMVRTHLPFASMRETLYRVVSMYFTAQHFRARNGMSSEHSLKGLIEIYEDIGIINRDMSERIGSYYRADANANAMVILHCLGEYTMLSLEEDLLEEIEQLFSPYLED
jgi:hypothetical protein